MVRHVGALSAWTAWLPLFPAPGGVPFSLAVIIVYYIAFDISIDKLNNIEFDILLILYIAFDRFSQYNKATMGEGLSLYKPSPDWRDYASIKSAAESSKQIYEG